MLNKENLNNAEIFLTGWERGLFDMKWKSKFSQTREKYGATDVEMEVGTMMQLLALICRESSLKTRGNRDKKLSKRVEILRDLTGSIQKMPARLSLGQKYKDLLEREGTING